MKIKWANLIAFALLILGGWILAVAYEPAKKFLNSIQHMGPGHGMREQTMGMVVIGFLGLVVVAVVKILVKDGGNRRR